MCTYFSRPDKLIHSSAKVEIKLRWLLFVLYKVRQPLLSIGYVKHKKKTTIWEGINSLQLFGVGNHRRSNLIWLLKMYFCRQENRAATKPEHRFWLSLPSQCVTPYIQALLTLCHIMVTALIGTSGHTKKWCHKGRPNQASLWIPHTYSLVHHGLHSELSACDIKVVCLRSLSQ